MADIAAGRAAMYTLLVSVFRLLPDSHFTTNIKGSDFQDLLNICESLEDATLTAGVGRIRSYRSHTSGHDMLTELAVDRTRILRATGYVDLKPPYEGLYRDEKRRGASALQVKRSYRKAGLLPDEAIGESPDYLCVELDFMRQLCSRERTQWLSGGDVTETITRQEEFLRDHLGAWIGEFCARAGQHASTEFYRGFLILLDRFIRLDLEYLQSLAGVSMNEP